jgi:hypothetical protein
MSEDIAANVSLLSLDQLNIGFHAFRGIRLGEKVTNVSVRVQSSKLQSS